MQYVFPPQVVALPVVGSDQLFPARRIYCVGRNYVEHAIEMGHTGREAPFFFMKPTDALLIINDGQTGEMPYPSETNDLHHEMEMVVAIGKGGRNIAVEDAASHIWGYALGLDMTRRDLQAEAKKLSRPWDLGKAFDASAPIGPLHRVQDTGIITEGSIALTVNGQPRQKSDVKKLIWSVDEMIAHLSRYFELQPGDLIFSGTPEGVAAVKKGDLMVGSVDKLGELKVRIV
jgi:fumarylpyruvate hydrolase